MLFVKYIKSRTLASCVLALLIILTFSPFVYAVDFNIPNGTTAKATQFLTGGETGIVQEGGAIKPPDDDRGVQLTGNNNNLNNYGSISTKGDFGHGILTSGGSGSIVHNRGDISVSGSNARGIFVSGGSGHTFNNSGSILGTGFQGHGIIANGTSGNTFNNFKYGSIETTNTNSYGQYFFEANGNTFNNYGSISTSGSSSDGIRLSNLSSSNTINNYRGGSISVKGANSTAIIICDPAASDGNIINNYGRVLATGLADMAIVDHPNNSNNTLNIFPGSQIVGLIDFDSNNDVINIFGNGGAGSSSTLMFEGTPTINRLGNYVFNVGGTPGSHFFIDPTGQSASGASLASLTGGIHGVIDRQLRQGQNPNPTQLASTRVEPGMMSQETGPKAWVSAFGSHRNRRNDDQQMLGYDHDYYGGVAGYEMTLGSMRVGAMAGYARSDFATDFTSIQTDSDSFFGGAYAQMKLGRWFDLGFTLLAGYEDINNDRLVVDNINGFETAEGDFNSFFLSPSVTISAPLKVSARTQIRPSLSLNYSVGFQDDYTETGTTQSNMTVEDRTVHALISRAQISVAHRFTNRIDTETRVGFQSRYTDNGVVNMTLAGSSFSFPTTGDDHVMGGFFGANIGYRITDRLNVNLDGEYTMSEGDETNIASQLGMEFIF